MTQPSRMKRLASEGAVIVLSILLAFWIDAWWERRQAREAETTVLESIGADKIPVIRVFNKIDRTGQEAALRRDESGKPSSVSISALSGDGIDGLRDAVGELLSSERINRWIELAGRDARLRAQLFELGVVSEERIAENGSWMLHVDLPRETAERLARLPGKEGQVARRQLLTQAEAGA